MPDEIVNAFHDCACKPARVVVQLRLRDQSAAPMGIKIHHLHHIAQIEMQTTVLFLIVLKELDQYLFLDIGIPGYLTPIARLKQILLALEESPPLKS
jgi:hypothetical protein